MSESCGERIEEGIQSISAIEKCLAPSGLKLQFKLFVITFSRRIKGHRIVRVIARKEILSANLASETPNGHDDTVGFASM
jgi:hypothetical protein